MKKIINFKLYDSDKLEPIAQNVKGDLTTQLFKSVKGNYFYVRDFGNGQVEVNPTSPDNACDFIVEVEGIDAAMQKFEIEEA